MMVEYLPTAPTQQAPPQSTLTPDAIRAIRAYANALMGQRPAPAFGVKGGLGSGLENLTGKIAGALEERRAPAY